MREINDYRIGEVAKLCEPQRSTQTLRLWEKWSDQLEEQGRPRLIPKPLRKEIGAKVERVYTKEMMEQIVEFSRSIRQGDLTEFTHNRYLAKKERRMKNGNQGETEEVQGA